MRCIKKSLSVLTDMKEGTIEVIVNGNKAADASFIFDGTQIRVINVDTRTIYQKCGYGRLLFDSLKCIARQKKLPLLLWSSDMGIPFYEKLGFLHLNNSDVQKLVIIGNIKSQKDLDKKLCEKDFVWIPSTMKRKPIIYL